MVKAYKKAMNAESRRMILPYYEEKNGKKVLKMPWLNYANIAKDAGNDTKKALKKIVVGQVIYYVLPPVVFETQMLTRKKGMTLDHFLRKSNLVANELYDMPSISWGKCLKESSEMRSISLSKHFLILSLRY